MAVRLAANGDYLSTSSALNYNAAYTIVFWYRMASFLSGSRTLISIARSGTEVDSLDTSSPNNIIANANGNTQTLGGTITAGTWIDLVLRRNSIISLEAGTAGFFSSPVATNVTSRAAATNLYCGRKSTTTEWADGKIANVKIWTAALTNAEIAYENLTLRPQRLANLWAWYPMIDLSSPACGLDYGGGGRDFAVNGAPAYEDGPPVMWGGRTWQIPFVVVGGGASYNQSAAGSLTPAGVPIKRTSTVKTGSVTPTGVPLKQARKFFAGTMTPTGALIKQARKFFTGALTPAGAMTYTRGYIRTLTGSLTPTGEIIRSVGKRVAGVLTPAGAAIKATSKRFVGSLTPTGFLAAFAPIIIQLGGTLAPAAALIKRTSKYPSGLLIPAGALIRAVAKYFTGALTPTGAISTTRGYIRTVTGALTPAGAIVKQAGKQVAGVLTPTSAIIRATSFHVAGLLAPAGAVVKQTRKFFSGALSFVGSLLGTTIGRATISHSLVYGATMTQRTAYGAGMTFSLVGGASIEVT